MILVAQSNHYCNLVTKYYIPVYNNYDITNTNITDVVYIVD